jgi:hypothetical protein
MESTMKPGTAKIMMEYPEVGKLYSVHLWNIVHHLGFILPGRTEIDYEWEVHDMRIVGPGRIAGHARMWADRNPNIVLTLRYGEAAQQA